VYELPDLDKEKLNMITLSPDKKVQMHYQNTHSLKSEHNSSDNQSDARFIGDFKNDGITGNFDSLEYPHSRDMMNVGSILKIKIFNEHKSFIKIILKINFLL
jgi:hypothetical protein